MNTNEQAPESCPFCGAARKAGCGFRWFECGTMTAPADNNRRDQTPACATAERERLTRERDEAKKAAETAMVELGQVASSRRDLLTRVKRLEEAVGSLLPYAEATDDESSEWGPGRWKSEKLKRIIDEARKAKEAKP